MIDRRDLGAVAAAAAVATLGGLIGLGGAEFRLPLLLGVFAFPPLRAVVLNKATSLVVVAASLPLRAATVPWAAVFASWHVVVTLLCGSLFGAWCGASWATRLASATLFRVIAVLLVALGVVLALAHGPEASGQPLLEGAPLLVTGVALGFGIGVVASFMGVAGGELLIPTIVVLFGIDLKLAGSLSLAVSLPTMLAGFARYSADDSFAVLSDERRFLAFTVVGSLIGSFVGARLLGVFPAGALLPILAAILFVSAVKVWRHAVPDGQIP